MSDHDAAPDPIDDAYVRAEALLSDDEARAVRRARILSAVADESADLPAVSATPLRRPARPYGGWLAAASVVGLSVLVATRLYQPTPRQSSAAPPPLASPAATASADAAIEAPSRRSQPQPTSPHDMTPDTAGAPAPVSIDRPQAAPPPPMSIKPVEPPLPPPPAPATLSPDERSADAPAADRFGMEAGLARDAQAQSRYRGALIATPRSEQAERLRDAATAGLTAKVKALLAQGVPVDAPDAEGETALMKSIEADHPATAALLRRHGASLDARNHAGERAGDMAIAKGDPDLNDALGLGP